MFSMVTSYILLVGLTTTILVISTYWKMHSLNLCLHMNQRNYPVDCHRSEPFHTSDSATHSGSFLICPLTTLSSSRQTPCSAHPLPGKAIWQNNAHFLSTTWKWAVLLGFERLHWIERQEAAKEVDGLGHQTPPKRCISLVDHLVAANQHRQHLWDAVLELGRFRKWWGVVRLFWNPKIWHIFVNSRFSKRISFANGADKGRSRSQSIQYSNFGNGPCVRPRNHRCFVRFHKMVVHG